MPDINFLSVVQAALLSAVLFLVLLCVVRSCAKIAARTWFEEKRKYLRSLKHALLGDTDHKGG